MNTVVSHLLAANWWLILLRGFAAIVFGILAFAWPGATLLTLIILYGAYVAADGALAIAAAVRGGTMVPRWWLVLVGAISLIAAAATFFYPGLTALLLITLIGIWSVARGITEIVGAMQVRKEIDNEWLLILEGILSVLFGLFVLMRPGQGALALIWVIGAFAIAEGALLVGFAFRLRRHRPVT